MKAIRLALLALGLAVDAMLFLMICNLSTRQADTIEKTLIEQHIYLDNQEPVLNNGPNHHKIVASRSLTASTNRSTIQEEKGYLFPYSIYEEQTNAAKNLWQLQILGKTVGMQVVEPFAKDSFFTMSGIAPNFSQALRFGDYIDKENWNNMVTEDGGTPLVQWEDFLTKAPRKLIILHTIKNNGKTHQTSLNIAYDENTTMCKTEQQIAHDDMQWIKETFNIIKMVCINSPTRTTHPLSIQDFISLILKDNDVKLNQVTVMIVNWIGIRSTRVHLLPTKIYTTVLHGRFTFPPSKRIMTAYKAYVQQYIGDHKYVGIVFRTHHVLYFSPLKGSFENQSKYLLQCCKNLSEVLDPIRAQWEIFLAYDMGRFGSKNYVARNQLTDLQEQIFLDVFNGSLQVNEREQNLINATGGVTDTGVIAELERVIANNADCIILLGSHSTFIRSAASSYSMIHQTNRCIISVCSEPVYDDHKKLISLHVIPDQFLTN